MYEEDQCWWVCSCDHSPILELHERPHVMHVNDDREVSTGMFGPSLWCSHFSWRPAVVRSRSRHCSIICNMFYATGSGLQQSFSSLLALCCTSGDCTSVDIWIFSLATMLVLCLSSGKLLKMLLLQMKKHKNASICNHDDWTNVYTKMAASVN